MLDSELLRYLTQAGVAGVLAVLVVSFLRGWIVPGYIVAQKDKDISTLRESVIQLQNEITEQIKMNQQSQTMADKMREVAKQVLAETRRR